MIPSFLITVREVLEASLIVATILGILVRLGHTSYIRTVWIATGCASFFSIALIGIGSLLGVKIQELYTGKTEEIIEGILMVVSAGFITWAVFFLHQYFASYKTKLLVKIKDTVQTHEQKGLFVLVFTAVLREGFEIILFLSTIYLSSNPRDIFAGFGAGALVGLAISYGFFVSAIRLPVYYAFRVTSVLLILFAAGLLARGIHEFHEAGFYPEVYPFSLPLLPEKTTIAADMIKAVFGLTKKMDLLQMSLYACYTSCMMWWVFFRRPSDHHHSH